MLMHYYLCNPHVFFFFFAYLLSFIIKSQVLYRFRYLIAHIFCGILFMLCGIIERMYFCGWAAVTLFLSPLYTLPRKHLLALAATCVSNEKKND